MLTDDLLVVVRQEYAKVQAQLQQQQVELHQAQAQYAAYSAMGVRNTPFDCHAYSSILTFFSFCQGYVPPPPSAPAPPPPPGEGPPPPPSGTPAGDVAAQYAAAGPPAPSDTEAYAAYW